MLNTLHPGVCLCGAMRCDTPESRAAREHQRKVTQLAFSLYCIDRDWGRVMHLSDADKQEYTRIAELLLKAEGEA